MSVPVRLLLSALLLALIVLAFAREPTCPGAGKGPRIGGAVLLWGCE